MCYVLEPKEKIKITKKPMMVFKITFEDRLDQDSFKSEIYYHTYRYGIVNNREKLKRTKMFKNSKFKNNPFIIREGYHSYSCPFNAYQRCNSVILNCFSARQRSVGVFIIPKNNKYYSSNRTKEIVSENIIYKGILDMEHFFETSQVKIKERRLNGKDSFSSVKNYFRRI